jgi:hypothetical protein
VWHDAASHKRHFTIFYCARRCCRCRVLPRQTGFEVTRQEPKDDPFFAIVCRGGAMLMVKSVEAAPAPNATRDPWARWDAYVSVPDPDALAAEFRSRGVALSVPLKDTTDGLRGFELKDADGYVLFFGRPRENSN